MVKLLATGDSLEEQNVSWGYRGRKEKGAAYKAVPANTISGRVPTGTLSVLNCDILRNESPSIENSSMSRIL